VEIYFEFFLVVLIRKNILVARYDEKMARLGTSCVLVRDNGPVLSTTALMIDSDAFLCKTHVSFAGIIGEFHSRCEHPEVLNVRSELINM
jgi:hypothetical protein